MRLDRTCVLALAVFVFGDTALAHHSFASVFDRDQPVTLEGAVTRVEWLNPHARFFLDAETDGQVEQWELELASPNGLMRLGWTRNSLAIGERVTVEAFRARDGANHAFVESVTRQDGSKVFSGNRIQGGLD